MPQIRKILVPIDFSEHSQQALDDAGSLAKRAGAELHLLHCLASGSGAVAPYGIAIPESLEHDLHVAALRRLSEWSTRVRATGLAVEEHLSRRPPAETIAVLARQIGADLVVMGTRGQTGIRHVLLGSVAETTIRTAPCPVLTVKRPRAS